MPRLLLSKIIRMPHLRALACIIPVCQESRESIVKVKPLGHKPTKHELKVVDALLSSRHHFLRQTFIAEKTFHIYHYNLA